MAKINIKLSGKELRQIILDHVRSNGIEVPSTATIFPKIPINEELSVSVTFEKDISYGRPGTK